MIICYTLNFLLLEHVVLIQNKMKPTAPIRRTALHFIILLGVVSLFADMTYEGARGIAGPYLGVLGASATVVGVVAGLSEFLGYGLRLISGYIVDKTAAYWKITFLGYALNLLAVPLLTLTQHW